MILRTDPLGTKVSTAVDTQVLRGPPFTLGIVEFLVSAVYGYFRLFRAQALIQALGEATIMKLMFFASALCSVKGLGLGLAKTVTWDYG